MVGFTTLAVATVLTGGVAGVAGASLGAAAGTGAAGTGTAAAAGAAIGASSAAGAISGAVAGGTAGSAAIGAVAGGSAAAGVSATGAGGTALAGGLALGPVGWIIIGAEMRQLEEGVVATFDCWKAVVRDCSEIPSTGMSLAQLCSHPHVARVCSSQLLDDGQIDFLPVIELENVWGERWRLDYLQLSGNPQIFGHVVPV